MSGKRSVDTTVVIRLLNGETGLLQKFDAVEQVFVAPVAETLWTTDGTLEGTVSLRGFFELGGMRPRLDTSDGNQYHTGMKVIRGKVVSGKVVVEGSLPEGAMVTVLAPEGGLFTLAPDEETALLAAISEADRGEVVEAESVLRKLGSGEE